MKVLLKQYGGRVLMLIGTVLLIVCHLAGWQSNTELLIGLMFIVLGYFSHLWLQKWGEKY